MDMDAELALLLEEQEKFMQSGKASSVKLHTKKSTISGGDDVPAASSLPLPPSVVRPVVMERSTPARTLPMSSIAATAGGFPSTKKTSLFGRRRQQTPPAPPTTNANIPDDIQADNNAAIAKMSIEEIRTAQADIEASLPPEIVEMLRKRGGTKAAAAAPPPSTAPPAANKIQAPGQSILSAMELVAPAPQNDVSLRQAVSELPEEERLKHEWMRALPDAPTSSSSSSVRLDLQGNVIDATAETMPLHSGLFHHGLEPDLAGYTTDELLMLARSTVSSQRAMALSVLAKTLRQHTMEPTTAMALVARSACEDSNQSVLLGGIDTLHACLVQFSLMAQVDTVALTPVDAQGHVHVVEYIDEDEITDVKGIQDPIQALLFTQFPARLLYLLDQNRVANTHAQMQLLDIAIVVAMHSRRAAAQLVEGPGVHTLLKAYLSVESLEALLRVQESVAKTLLLILRLCQADKVHAVAFLDHHVLASTKVFLAMRHPALLPLQMLTMRIWRVCLAYELDQSSVAYLFPLLCGYSAQSLTQSLDTVPLEPWPLAMQECILDAMVYIVSPDTIGFLPFFLHQASTIAASNAHALAFLTAIYPLVFQFPSLDLAPFQALWPTLHLHATQSPALVVAIVDLFAVVAAHPHPALHVDVDATLEFVQRYVMASTTISTSVAATLLHFVATHGGDGAWVRAQAYPLFLESEPGQPTTTTHLLTCILQHPALVALYQAMLTPSSSSSSTTETSCHTILPEHKVHSTSLPPPPSWLFSLFSRLHSMESHQETTVLRLLLATLGDMETTQAHLLASIPTQDKLIHLAHVYFWEAESWRDTQAQLHPLVLQYIRGASMADLMASADRIVALQQQSTANFLTTLIQTFCNVSYGDVALAQVLTVFLTAAVPAETRLAVWNQVAQFQCLHLLETASDLETPYVVDEALLDAFVQAVVRGHLSAEKGATMYRIVLHHIGHFVFSGSVDSTRKHAMLLHVFKAANPALIRDVVCNPSNESTVAMLQRIQDLPAFAPFRDQISQYT
ncbi:Aste57867_21369 [Aphanomyces stellatus]|uniref:Aste57867_21369 protein n=1 Tax=Aphanomyces stellatus TaxID=120398 RepID=A0A485LLX0_9STRA|nr:hypothetical protein As57867_021300 [Aphanomyces stellatus]VFT98041.1 Aste57867_21369 [Aphanomyces stellatus]